MESEAGRGWHLPPRQLELHRAGGDREHILLPKYWLPCAPMPNKNTETGNLEEERDGFIFLPGRREDTAG